MINKVLKSICGEDEFYGPNAAVVVSTEIYENGALSKVILENPMNTPTFTIIENGSYFIVDMDFKSHNSTDLLITNQQVKEHFELFENLSENQIPVLQLTIVSKTEDYYMTAINPLFFVLTTRNTDEYCSVLKFVFEADNVDFFATDGSLRELAEAEVKTEIENQLF